MFKLNLLIEQVQFVCLFVCFSLLIEFDLDEQTELDERPFNKASICIHSFDCQLYLSRVLKVPVQTVSEISDVLIW